VVLTVVGGAGISWQGHLGGLLGGLAAAAILVLPARHHRRRWQWPGLAALTGLLLAVIVARVIMLR
jgi:membrane associated rhomboid family serine protease